MLLDEPPDGSVTFREPRPLVEQFARGKERREVDLAEPDPELGQLVHLTPERVGDRRVAGGQDRIARHTDDHVGGRGRWPLAPRCDRPRVDVPTIRMVEHAEHDRGVVRGEREHRDTVEGAARRDDPDGADQAERRLAPDDVAERGRDPTRPGGVGAERERNEPGRDGDPRARTRPAGHDRRIERVDRCAIGRPRPDQPGGELVEVRLAHDDTARAHEPADGHRRVRRGVGERRAPGGGRHPGDVDVVLDGERDPRQRSVVHGVQTGADRVVVHPADPDRGIAGRRDAVDRRVDHVAGGQVTSAIGGEDPRDGPRLAGDRHVGCVGFVGHAFKDARSASDDATAPKTPPCIVTIFNAA